MDVVIRQASSVFELFSGEDKSLLIWGNSFLVLNLGLDVLDRVGGLDLEGDGLAGQGLDEDLHASAQTKDEMEGRLLLDVVIRQGTAILELLA